VLKCYVQRCGGHVQLCRHGTGSLAACALGPVYIRSVASVAALLTTARRRAASHAMPATGSAADHMCTMRAGGSAGCRGAPGASLAVAPPPAPPRPAASGSLARRPLTLRSSVSSPAPGARPCSGGLQQSAG
jgi:hypothetical protein